MIGALRLPRRFGGRTPTARDASAAFLLIGVVLLSRIGFGMANGSGEFPGSWSVFLLANVPSVLDLATIALRRRIPRTALGLATAVVIASSALPTAFTGTGVGVVVCAYTVGTLLPRRGVILALTGFGAVHAVGGAVAVSLGVSLTPLLTFLGNDGSTPVQILLASMVSYGMPGLLGLYIQARRSYIAELSARLSRADIERELRASEAVAEERRRIARELHDVAAHDLSAIIVQAGATDRLIDGDPAAAKAALRAIRAQGRETLTAMRGLVGIMRAGGEHPDDEVFAPQPSIARLEELVAGSRRLGMSVESVVCGSPRTLPAVIDLAAYRLLQEGLTNARRHAPGAPVTLTVRYESAALVVSVTNTAAVQASGVVSEVGSGHGLVGMRERVHHAGGMLSAGPISTGGWCVEARFPLSDRDRR
ncbi:histidine kinase [Actinoalloteichus hymeniacidonis]|uniref:histidine kinase n=2 Tax=Actinoalloteichus hymeniacidonis TaxID=340345 RepID=A0AAC9HTC1_9PSEU|nr:histidine kinase [Actinoalloteichus hymeniacidonis]